MCIANVNILFPVSKQILTEDKSDQQKDVKNKLCFLFSKCEEMCPQWESSGFPCNLHIQKKKSIHKNTVFTTALWLQLWQGISCGNQVKLGSVLKPRPVLREGGDEARSLLHVENFSRGQRVTWRDYHRCLQGVVWDEVMLPNFLCTTVNKIWSLWY